MDCWKYTVTIPTNCTAELHLPEKTPVTLESGTHTF